MLRFYDRLLQTHPLKTKCLSSGALFSLGDIITQNFFSEGKFSWKRNFDFFLMGAGYIAPMLHGWYCKLLPRVQSIVMPNAGKAVKVFGSMAMDQLIFAPILLTIFYPLNQIIIERDIKAFERGVQVWRDKIKETMVTNWKIWPLAMTINFWFMPAQYQVLFSNFIGLFWNVILSYIAHK